MVNIVLTAGDDVFAWTQAQIDDGRDGDDTITGLAGNDDIDAGVGSNTVYGGVGNDLIESIVGATSGTKDGQRFYGGEGQDVIVGGAVNDLLSGDVGNDMLIGREGNDTLFGNAGDDVFRAYTLGYDQAAQGQDVIYGGDGNDFVDILADIKGTLYSAMVYGGLGDDEILAAAGAHQIYGGDGQDTVFAVIASEADYAEARFEGGAGIDLLQLSIADQTTPEASAEDKVLMTRNGAGFDIAVNGVVRASVAGFDNLSLTVRGDSTLLGGSGNDFISVFDGDATISAGYGFDRVQLVLADGAALSAHYDLDGGGGRDRLTLIASGQQTVPILLDMRGAEGKLQIGDGPQGRVVGFELFSVGGTGLGDTVFAGAENDTITEAPAGEVSGEDNFHGGAGDDVIFAGDQNDQVYGDAGNDVLSGGQGRDLIMGGLGDDIIRGDLETDRLYGQGGADVFVFSSTFDSGIAKGEIDNIFDFTALSRNAVEADKINLYNIGSFTFIGTDAFTEAGQVRVQQAAGGTFVAVNLEGTNGAEMKISLVGVTATDISLADFIW